MLKSWSIENFKPIVNSGELKLAPVTVLAGMNSSGKSSLLQSILMISQTLSSRVLDRPLLPNGPIVQLGTFEDILHEKIRSNTLTVSFELDTENKEPELIPGGCIGYQESIKVTAKFSSATDETISSAIEASRVSVENVLLETKYLAHEFEENLDLFSYTYKFIINKATRSKLDTFLKNVSTEYLSLLPSAEENASFLGDIDISSDKHALTAQFLVVLSHFLPTKLIQKFAEEERRKRRLKISFNKAVRMLLNNPHHAKDIIGKFPDIFTSDFYISNELKSIIDSFCRKSQIKTPFNGKSFSDLIEWFEEVSLERNSPKTRQLGSYLVEPLLKILMQDLLKNEATEKSEGLEVVSSGTYGVNLDKTVGQITRFFTSKIRYLGPLRADPQASQKFSPSSELDDVGAKGEYAAAVYDANQNARIEWFNPFIAEVEQGTLKIALDSWTQYLGVANQIKIETAGQSGFSWQVIHKEGQKPLPLAAVGVGVSQVLPILVMGLLAPRDTLLIIEQPELHLHPRVQARLGDFFVGLSQCNKQCLIETHSENLVNQLRYHIVASGGQEKSDCMIYFVDQDEKGATQFEPVEISPKGNILNWPSGFFDETMLQEDRITAASIRKVGKLAKDG